MQYTKFHDPGWVLYNFMTKNLKSEILVVNMLQWSTLAASKYYLLNISKPQVLVCRQTDGQEFMAISTHFVILVRSVPYIAILVYAYFRPELLCCFMYLKKVKNRRSYWVDDLCSTDDVEINWQEALCSGYGAKWMKELLLSNSTQVKTLN